MRNFRILLVLLLCLLPLLAKKKKDETQVLALPADPPAAVAAETRTLVFHTSPLSGKGLLSQQTKDAVRALLKLNNAATIVKIRAFVAGRGDMRRVRDVISESLSERHLPLPAVTVVQVGGLPLEGAQVVLESISLSRRDVNPSGLLFLAGVNASVPKPLEPTLPLALQSITALETSLGEAPAVRVTCFTSSLEEAPKVHALAASHFPGAAIDVVQTLRAMPRTMVECEATARAVRTAAPKLAFTGTQVAFGFEDKDARLAFQRLDKSLEPLGTSTAQAVAASFYPLSLSIAEQVRKIRLEFFSTPTITLLPFEGLPSMDASFAVEVVAVVP